MSERPVATDALATLGTIIDDTQKRDAIHLAVEPVIAGERLHPGETIRVADGVAWSATDQEGALGIVDPFIKERRVDKGQRFWFVMYPRLVHSLRHVWVHPAFPDEAGTSSPVADSKATSEAWLRAFCASADCPSYEEVVAAAIKHQRQGNDWGDDDYLHFSGSDAHGEIPGEFWAHMAVVTGLTFATKPTSFSCSC